jgi:hypothetical protein
LYHIPLGTRPECRRTRIILFHDSVEVEADFLVKGVIELLLRGRESRPVSRREGTFVMMSDQEIVVMLSRQLG